VKKQRSLDVIADDINRLERSSIFDIGGLLVEAKALCENGEWCKWIWTNFQYAESTARRYMQAARLAAKSRTVRDLKISARTVYALAGEAEADLPAIIKELAKHATNKRLPVIEAERVIKIGIGRRRFGEDLPDATLLQGAPLDGSAPWHRKAMAALRNQQPDDDDAAREIVGKLESEHDEAKWAKYVAAHPPPDEEAESILDSEPPDLPPPITPPEPQALVPTFLGS
jgi:hypothetical protein